MDGGLKGNSDGKTNFPWYNPPEKKNDYGQTFFSPKGTERLFIGVLWKTRAVILVKKQ
jgi:hypothetical protein